MDRLVHIRINQLIDARLQAECARRGLPMSVVVRRMLDKHLPPLEANDGIR